MLLPPPYSCIYPLSITYHKSCPHIRLDAQPLAIRISASSLVASGHPMSGVEISRSRQLVLNSSPPFHPNTQLPRLYSDDYPSPDLDHNLVSISSNPVNSISYSSLPRPVHLSFYLCNRQHWHRPIIILHVVRAYLSTFAKLLGCLLYARIAFLLLLPLVHVRNLS